MSTKSEVTLGGRFSPLFKNEITNIEEYYMVLKTIINTTTEEVVGIMATRHVIRLSFKIEEACEKRIKLWVKMINSAENS